jgi:adenylate cyclase
MALSFGEFELDIEAAELRSAGKRIDIEPQVFDLIALLATNPGRCVTKDEIIDKVWNGRIVSDSAISTRINAARKALGDDGTSQKIIKTVHGRGFRFDLTPRPDVTDSATEDNLTAGIVNLSEPVPGFEGRPAIAVLPFNNLSQDPEQEFLADGIAEDILTRLAMWRWLPVIARNSSFTYKHQAIDVKTVGQELGARYILEGSVRKAGNRVRITGQLIDSETGHHVWADRFDDDLDDVFALQDDITDAVVAALEPAVGRAEMQRAQRRNPTSIDAWTLYQRGIAQLTKATREGLDSARDLFQRSIDIDPGFAPPFAGTAIAHFVDRTIGYTDDPEALMEEAHESALIAVSLDDLDPFAHAGLAYSSFQTGNHESAVAAGRRAIELNPSFALGHHALGASLFASGEQDEAVEALSKAIRISPNDPWLFLFLGALSASFYMQRDYASSVEASRRAVQRFPWYPSTLRWHALALAQLERFDEAREALAKFLQFAPRYSMELARNAYVFRRQVDLDHFLEGHQNAGLGE